MFRQMQPASAARHLAIERKILTETVFEIDRKAEEVAVEFHRLADIEDAEDRDRRLQPDPGWRRLARRDPGSENIPLVEAKLFCDELQGLGVGDVEIGLGQFCLQRPGHKFGIAKVAHDRPLVGGEVNSVSASADPSPVSDEGKDEDVVC